MKSKINPKLHHIKKIVGEPYYEDHNVLLYNMDCLDFMRKLNNPVIDLTITSPPYNIGKEYEDERKIDEYLHWSQIWIEEVYKITKNNGAFWLNLGYFKVPLKGHAVPIPYLLWDKTRFYFLQEIVWHYGAGVAAWRIFAPRNEKFLWYVKNKHDYTFNLDAIRDKEVKYPTQKKNGKLKVNPNGKNPTNVWSIPKVTSGRGNHERTPHPAQSPLAVIDRIVKSCSTRNDIVFDPFLGSGTMALSAVMNNRCAIGCEIKPKYLEIAKSRIEKYLASES
jgi:adenine-specific DNA-methyltransferase